MFQGQINIFIFHRLKNVNNYWMAGNKAKTNKALRVPVFDGVQSQVPASCMPCLVGLPMLLLQAGPIVTLGSSKAYCILASVPSISEPWESLLSVHTICGRASWPHIHSSTLYINFPKNFLGMWPLRTQFELPWIPCSYAWTSGDTLANGLWTHVMSLSSRLSVNGRVPVPCLFS